jgi:hypothetical protein
VDKQTYTISVLADTDLASNQGARQLGDELREVPGVTEVHRQKREPTTMDLGVIVQIVATSASTLAIARGIADWIRRNRGTQLKIERDGISGSIKAEIQNFDPEIAQSITDILLKK